MITVWTGPALDDLENIRRYSAKTSIRNAGDPTGQCILEAVEQLEVTPEIGRPGRVAGSRELVLPDLSYIIAYRVTAGSLEVLRVLHTSRRWPKRL